MSTVALHHKYRPQILAELVGQPYIKTALTNAVKHLQIAPAYLLTGSRGTGKTSTARIFAKSLNCLNTKKPTDQPCGICQSCRSIESSNSLDVSEIDAASHNGVDDARTLIERCTLAPVAGRYRIFILDECLSGDSLVLTDSGWMRIDDPNIINKKALSYNEKTQQWEFKAITRHWSKGQRKTLVIKTATTEIRCTPEHLIRTENGWKKAESIQIGEKILVAPNTFLPKSDSIYSNLYDPFVLVDVENDLIFPPCINAAQLNILSTPTGKSTRPSRTTILSNPLKIKLPCLNHHDLFVLVDVAENLISQCIYLKTEHLLPASFSIGNNIPITIGMVVGNAQSKIGIMPSYLFHLRAWDGYMEPYLVMVALTTPMLNRCRPDCPGLTELIKKTGYDINAISYPNSMLRLQSYPIKATVKHPFVPELSAIQTFEKSVPWYDQMEIKNRLIQNGLIRLVKKDWHGGTWMMDTLSTFLQGHYLLHCILKGIRNQKIDFYNSGLNHLDIQLLFGKLESQTKSTIVLDSQPRVVESGLNPSVNTQFQQWDTNSTSVESVHWSDLVEPVYDLEIADNHNFVANGLLVHNCHQLTTQSQNALLKCIEEPPPHVVFILCTTEQHKVLPTIISRCQVLNFRTLSVQAIVQHLRIVADAESITINDEALSAIARLSDGGLRDALQLLGQVRLLDTAITAHHVMEMAGGVTETELMAIFQAISTNNTFNLLQVARELVDSGKTPKLILANLLQTYRDLLIIKSAPQSQALLTGCLSHTQLTTLAKHWNFDTLNLSLAELQKAESYLRSAVNAAVWLEVCLLNLMPGLLPVAATKTVNKPMYDKGHSGKLLPTFGVYTTNKVTAKPVDDQGDDRKLLPTVAANSSNLAQIWQQVLDTAKPSSHKLLSHAKLVKLQDNKAILEVTPVYRQKFEGNKQAIAKMLQRATQSQTPITVLIQTANYGNHGG
ncbi:hypothetical protein [Anabaena sp. CCY 0017]|uniref:hypothetical protein n=1 Tax=Anabaena sp. CCY 0017 TaxID=3103866 RepID=UPI0039C697F3